MILYGLPEDMEPEREHLANRLAMTLGSSSAIFAHNLARLGSRVGFISRIGNDPLGAISLERLAEGGVEVSKVRKVPGATTTGLTVILPHSRFRHILTYPGTMFEMNFEDIDIDYLASARHFHLSSFFLHRALQPRIPELFHNFTKELVHKFLLSHNFNAFECIFSGINKFIEAALICVCNVKEPDNSFWTFVVEVFACLEFFLCWTWSAD
jgi:sugar/nucleoside kinase (ribokinase family)